MNMLMNRLFSFALLAAAAGTGAAQAGQQATFHLPFEAQWGGVTMAPGDYKVMLPQISLGTRQFYLSGQDARGYITPMVTDVTELTMNPSDRSYLQLVKVDGVFVVAKYQSGVTGAIFSFKVPKPRHNVRMAEQEVVKLGVSSN